MFLLPYHSPFMALNSL